MNIKVTIENIFETQSFGTNGFQKREWIGVDNSNTEYPQFIKFELIKDKCSLIDEFTEGQEVEVSFNINGRKYENPEKGTQYFVSLQSWKIEAVSTPGDSTPERDQNEAIANDDLPF